MRCQRCGFEIEPGQTFCSMCGTEQAKALRPAKKKKISSIFGIIKVTSTNHLKMWINLFLVIGLFFYIFYGRVQDVNRISYLCLTFLLFGYVFFQCLIPYKNPNASKSKKYKMGMRISFVLIFILLFVVLVTGEYSLLDLARSI